jgi:hypothetical protein
MLDSPVALLALGALLFVGYLLASGLRESRGRMRQERIRRARAEALRLSMSLHSDGVRPEPVE